MKRIQISDIGVTITGKTPSSEFPEDFGDKYMFVTPSDDFTQRNMNKTDRYISEIGASKLQNKLLPTNSIMVTCIGSAMGKVAMNSSPCITNQQINSIIPNENYFPEYVYYCLKNNYKLLRNAASGSTALPLLNKTDFDLLDLIVFENRDLQTTTASILASLDMKIELNNKINDNLPHNYFTFTCPFINMGNSQSRSSVSL